MLQPSPEDLRLALCELGIHIRTKVLEGRSSGAELSQASRQAGGDTIYSIDQFGEDAILEWFHSSWPRDWPVEVIMEGLEHDVTFPIGTPVSNTLWKCILDPIDGTRGLMYDKRSAWSLAGVAPQHGAATSLSHIIAAVMTEIPTTKQWRADQLSTCHNGPLLATSFDLIRHLSSPLVVQPSSARDFHHGFASFSKFFPEGRTLTAQIEERLWDELIGLNSSASPTVFDDQYLSTAGQFHELITGRDRLVADIRPIVLRVLDMPGSLVCHPYDACAALVLQNAGCLYEHPLGGFPDAPLDTSSGIAWIAFANPDLASLARPVIHKILRGFLP